MVIVQNLCYLYEWFLEKPFWLAISIQLILVSPRAFICFEHALEILLLIGLDLFSLIHSSKFYSKIRIFNNCNSFLLVLELKHEGGSYPDCENWLFSQVYIILILMEVCDLLWSIINIVFDKASVLLID